MFDVEDVYSCFIEVMVAFEEVMGTGCEVFVCPSDFDEGIVLVL